MDGDVDDARQNMILAALPDEEFRRVTRSMRRVRLEVGDVLYEQDDVVTDVYFPLSGAVSVLIQLEDGRMYEPGIIGHEGMLGFPIGLGTDVSRWRSVVQLPGEAMVIGLDALRGHLRQPGNLGPLLTHFASLLIALVAQSAACAQFHDLRQSCARWLLLMHDRARSDEFTMTHEDLSLMLGSHRPSVTTVLHALRDEGLIELGRRSIRITDRAGLEDAVCECYQRVQIKYEESVQVSAKGSIGARKRYGDQA